MTESENKELKIAGVKCLTSLLFFTRYHYYHNFNRRYTVRPHHVIIAEALEKVLKGEIKRLIINVAPRYGKTELAVKNFIAHGLALNPAAKFIHLSASDALALDNSEGGKDIVNSDSYQQLFPVKLKNSSDSKKKWYTTEGGGVYATAAGGQVTGFGAGQVEQEGEYIEYEEFLTELEAKEDFGGAILIDDPIKPDDTESEVKRVRVNERFHSTIKNRVNSRNTPIVIIQQRLHPKDLSGHLIAEDDKLELQGKPREWTVVSIPSLYMEDGQWVSLWPAKHTVEDFLIMQVNDPINFYRQYQQNPKPKEGLLFPDEDLKKYNPATVDLKSLEEFSFGFCDPADEGGDDLSFPAGYLVGDKVYIHDVVYNKKGTDVNEPRCVEFIKQHEMDAVEIESNSAWTLFRKAIKAAIEEDGSDCEIRSIKNTTNKHTRILAQSAFIRNHFIFREDWATYSPEYRRFYENLTSYLEIQSGTSKNTHEDAPDSLSGMAKYFRSQFAHLWRVKTSGTDQ